MWSVERRVGVGWEARWSGAGVGEDGFDLEGRLSWERREQVVKSLVLEACAGRGLQRCTLRGLQKIAGDAQKERLEDEEEVWD